MSAADRLSVLLRSLRVAIPGDEMRLLVVERPFLHKFNPHTAITLSQIQSACMTTAYLRGWAILEMDPTEIRKQIIGVGTSRKKGEIKLLVQQWVQENLHLTLNSDQADSVVIWSYARYALDHLRTTEEAS